MTFQKCVPCSPFSQWIRLIDSPAMHWEVKNRLFAQSMATLRLAVWLTIDQQRWRWKNSTATEGPELAGFSRGGNRKSMSREKWWKMPATQFVMLHLRTEAKIVISEDSELWNLISWYICPSQILWFSISSIDLSGMKTITSNIRFRDGFFRRRVLFLFYLVICFFLVTLPHWTNSDALVTGLLEGLSARLKIDIFASHLCIFSKVLQEKKNKNPKTYLPRTGFAPPLCPAPHSPPTTHTLTHKCINASNNVPHARLMISKRVQVE